MTKISYIIHQLERNQEVFRNLLASGSSDEIHWKPAPNKWCLLEIVCHLVDEEVDDFRARVRTALDPDKHPFYAIDPIAWVTQHKYMEQDFRSKVEQWFNERQESVNWLKSLDGPNWESTIDHDIYGPMSAGLFLANWLAHDYIHIRQINRTKRAYLNYISSQSLDYAGTW